MDKKGAVTVVPTRNPLIDKKGNRVDFLSLSESQQELVRQNKSYVVESEKHPDIEKYFRDLFKLITEGWDKAINEDADKRPFTKLEKEKLGSKRLSKAYGTTLMAAVRTPNYWFAFHIGDGKLLVCDKLMEWSEPVPWDCNCFLNVTTSLCDQESVSEFRYAFDGTGNFPIAFALGSDGIDDTFIQADLLYKFYSQMLSVFHEYPKEEALKHLRKHLPVLSEKGSHDDMSVAAIIDENELDLPLKYYSIISEVRSINKERFAKEEEINQLEKEHLNKVSDSNSIRDTYEQFCREAWIRFCDMIHRREKDQEKISSLKQQWNNMKDRAHSYNELLFQKKQEFEEWKNQKKIRINELKELAETYKGFLQVNPLDNNIESKEVIENQTTEALEIENVDIAKAQTISMEESEKWERESEEQVKEILNPKI